MNPKSNVNRSTEEPDSLISKLMGFLFGYDYFISYAHSDAGAYAQDLASQLQNAGFECFLDRQDFLKGEDWRSMTPRALSKTQRLILLASPAALNSKPVLMELEIFAGAEKKVIPIDFDGTLDRKTHQSEIFKHLTESQLWVSECKENLDAGSVSQEVLDDLINSYNLERQSRRRTRWIRRGFSVVMILFLLTVGLIAWRVATIPHERLTAETRKLEQLGVEVEEVLPGKYRIRIPEVFDLRVPENDSSLVKAVETIERYADIVDLKIEHNHFVNAASFPTLPSIEELSLWNSHVEDLSFLNESQNLERLIIAANRELEDADFSVFSKLHKLKFLDAHDLPQITSEALSGFDQLPIEDLIFLDCHQIDNSCLPTLRDLPLKNLNVHGTGIQIDQDFIALIKTLSQLEALAIDLGSPDDQRNMTSQLLSFADQRDITIETFQTGGF